MQQRVKARKRTQTQTQPKAHTITFSVTDGIFDYKDQDGKNAKRKHAKPLESIRWVTKGKQEFKIHNFKETQAGSDAWPFEGPPETLASSGGAVLPRTVSGKALLKIPYKYSVTMLPPCPSDDPEIIIDQ